jgi:hypothetical protein
MRRMSAAGDHSLTAGANPPVLLIARRLFLGGFLPLVIIFLSGGSSPGLSFSNLDERVSPVLRRTGPPEPPRASRQHVGTIMALLATFDDAGVLPPETSQDANRLIHALIQCQAAFMKSGHPAVQIYLGAALSGDSRDGDRLAAEQVRTEGLTSRSLEAIVDYSASRPPWEQPEVMDALREFNVGRPDVELIARTFQQARSRLAAQGRNIHAVYGARLKEMGRTRSFPGDHSS